MRVNRETLLQELETVRAGLSSREIFEQSSCVVFRKGRLVTFNDEVACSRTTVLTKLTGAVPAKPLMELLRKLQEDDVEINAKDGELLVKGKGRTSGIRMDGEITLQTDGLEVPGKWAPLPELFSEAVDLVQQCAGKDESEFITTCVHLHPKYLEATDNYQLTRFRLKLPLQGPSLVRRDAIKDITSLAMTQVSETDDWLHFGNASGLVYSCRRYTDQYQDIGGALKMDGVRMKLPKGLAEACEKAAIFSSENTDDDQVHVTLKAGKLILRGEGTSGWYRESKKISYTGEPLEFMIAPRLLGELVKRYNECEINASKLKVDGGRHVYLTVLGAPEVRHKRTKKADRADDPPAETQPDKKRRKEMEADDDVPF